MPFVPKDIPENQWKPLKPNRVYAVKSDKESDVHIRFGMGGMFLKVALDSSGQRFIHTLGVEDGNPTVLGKVKKNEITVVGRSSQNNIVISHAIVSRKHLELKTDGNVLMIKDLATTNGTFVHTENFIFDIEDYIEKHKNQNPSESTMDEVHEAFGPTIDDFLKSYSNK